MHFDIYAKTVLCYEPYEGIDIKEIYMHVDNYRLYNQQIINHVIYDTCCGLISTNDIYNIKGKIFLVMDILFHLRRYLIWHFLIDTFIMIHSAIISFWYIVWQSNHYLNPVNIAFDAIDRNSDITYRVRHQNPDKFQFKFSAILCIRQRLLLASEKAWCF